MKHIINWVKTVTSASITVCGKLYFVLSTIWTVAAFAVAGVAFVQKGWLAALIVLTVASVISYLVYIVYWLKNKNLMLDRWVDFVNSEKGDKFLKTI